MGMSMFILAEPRWRLSSKLPSIFGLIISWITGSEFSHGLVVAGDGKIYDSSWLRGNVGIADPFKKGSKRRILVFELPDKINDHILNGLIGLKYDRLGAFFWHLGLHRQKRLYCFEFQKEVLNALGYNVIIEKQNVTGKDIEKCLVDNGFSGLWMQETEFLEKYADEY